MGKASSKPGRTLVRQNIMVGSAVINPGDRVMLTVQKGTDHDHAKEILGQMQSHFPDVEFVVVMGLDVYKIEKGGADAEPA